MAKVFTPIAVIWVCGPVGIVGSILLFPLIKEVVSRVTTVAGNTFSHLILAPIGYLHDRTTRRIFHSIIPAACPKPATVQERRSQIQEQSIISEKKPFSVSVLGSIAGESAWAVFTSVVCPVPISGLGKNVVKVVVVSPFKQCGKAVSQYGCNRIFGSYREKPTDYLEPKEVFNEVAGFIGEDAMNSAEYDGVTGFLLGLAGYKVGSYVGRKLWNFGADVVSKLQYQPCEQEMFELLLEDEILMVHSNGEG